MSNANYRRRDVSVASYERIRPARRQASRSSEQQSAVSSQSDRTLTPGGEASHKASVRSRSPSQYEKDRFDAIERSPSQYEDSSNVIERSPSQYEDSSNVIERSPSQYEDSSNVIERSPSQYTSLNPVAARRAQQSATGAYRPSLLEQFVRTKGGTPKIDDKARREKYIKRLTWFVT